MKVYFVMTGTLDLPEGSIFEPGTNNTEVRLPNGSLMTLNPGVGTFNMLHNGRDDGWRMADVKIGPYATRMEEMKS